VTVEWGRGGPVSFMFERSRRPPGLTGGRWSVLAGTVEVVGSGSMEEERRPQGCGDAQGRCECLCDAAQRAQEVGALDVGGASSRLAPCSGGRCGVEVVRRAAVG
jgi:hypothetical protein